MLVIAFIPLALSGVLYLFGLPSLRLLIESRELSNDPAYSALRSAVVAVRADQRQGTGFAIRMNDESESAPPLAGGETANLEDTKIVILTNDHIIGDAENVQVSLKADDFQPVNEWLQWPQSDLAMILLPQLDLPAAFSKLTTLTLADSAAEPEPGDPLIVIGNPLNLFQITTEATFIGQTTLSGISGPVLMIKGPVFRGNSGSPVIDAENQVIGMVFAVADTDQADQGGLLTRGSILTAAQDRIAFLIPATTIWEQVNEP